jgi:hypothetical protein
VVIFRNARGKLVDATSEQQKSYDEELERISRVYQVKPDEAVKFPEMRFQGKITTVYFRV